jgi:hypothetical protein
MLQCAARNIYDEEKVHVAPVKKPVSFSQSCTILQQPVDPAIAEQLGLAVESCSL